MSQVDCVSKLLTKSYDMASEVAKEFENVDPYDMATKNHDGDDE